MKKLIFIPICFILLLGNITKSQEIDTIYRLLYGHIYVDPNLKPPVDDLLEIKWSVGIENFIFPPLVIDGIIFIRKNKNYAVDAETGKKLYFDSAEARQRFKETIKDSIIYLGDIRKPR